MNVQCPHCAADTPAASFCESCGKALPSLRPDANPRIVGGGLAASHAGAELQAADLAKTASSAFKVLLVLAVLQFIVGGLLTMLALVAPPMEADPDAAGAAAEPAPFAAMGIIVLILGTINLSLALWARKNPFPAALTGLVLYVTLWAADIAFSVGTDPGAITRGIVIKLLIVAALAKACAAGAKHRALMRQFAQTV